MTQQRKILVVDDEVRFTQMLSFFFRLKNYMMFTATDGEEALRIVGAEHPDLVLLDIQMPKVNGIEVLKRIRRDFPGMNVVVITGYEEEYRQVLKDLGVEGIYSKPVRLGLLTGKIDELFGHAGKKEEPSGTIFPLGAPYGQPVFPFLTVPHAKLLFVEAVKVVGKYLVNYFSDLELCGGNYEVSVTDQWENVREEIIRLTPDFILVHVEGIQLESFLYIVKNVPYQVKDVIVYGPFTEEQEVTALGMGAKVCDAHIRPLAERDISVALRNISEKDMHKLEKAVLQACYHYHLVQTTKDEKKDAIFSRVTKIFSEETHVPSGDIVPQLNLGDFFDPMAKTVFMMEIEKEFDLHISSSAAELLHTVRDVVLFIDKKK